MVYDSNMKQISDVFKHLYLRLSLTDRCNLNCVYCRPEKYLEEIASTHSLTREEIVFLCSMLVQNGLHHIRLTGGEPLLRPDLLEITSDLRELNENLDISLTTNGTLLAGKCQALKKAGLSRINISLDSFDRDHFANLTGHDRLDAVFAGIQEARRYNLAPVKLNWVLMNFTSIAYIPDAVRKAHLEGTTIRFIEYMNHPAWNNDMGETITCNQIHDYLSRYFTLIPADGSIGMGPAKYYFIKETGGEIGLIHSGTRQICAACNRIRITHDGQLLICIKSRQTYNIRPLLIEERYDDLVDIFHTAIDDKKDVDREGLPAPLYAIGG